MAGREVERFEVVPVELDFRTFRDLVAQTDEHVLEFPPDARDRMQMPTSVLAPAGREVDATPYQRDFAFGADQAVAALDQRTFERGPGCRHRLADVGARRSLHRLDRFADVVQRRRLAEESPLGGLQRVDGRGVRERPPAFPFDVANALDELGRGQLVDGHDATRRWRAASNSNVVPAIATFSDSAARIGIVT
jgi:hypothetical protein